jgi:hypothetical protein
VVIRIEVPLVAPRQIGHADEAGSVRTACIAGAILSAVYAGIAWGEDDAATAAFVALAALLAIFGVAGEVPRRIKSGVNEMESHAMRSSAPPVKTVKQSTVTAYVPRGQFFPSRCCATKLWRRHGAILGCSASPQGSPPDVSLGMSCCHSHHGDTVLPDLTVLTETQRARNIERRTTLGNEPHT